MALNSDGVIILTWFAWKIARISSSVRVSSMIMSLSSMKSVPNRVRGRQDYEGYADCLSGDGNVG